MLEHQEKVRLGTAKKKAEKTKPFIDWSPGLYYNDRLLS